MERQRNASPALREKYKGKGDGIFFNKIIGSYKIILSPFPSFSHANRI